MLERAKGIRNVVLSTMTAASSGDAHDLGNPIDASEPGTLLKSMNLAAGYGPS